MSEEIQSMTFSEKCAALLKVEQAIDGLAKKAADIAGAKRNLESEYEDLRLAIASEMQADGVTSAEECGLVFALQNKPRGVIVTDEKSVPDEYFKTIRTLDKTKLNAAVKEGTPVPGATLDNGGQILAIRAKGRK